MDKTLFFTAALVIFLLVVTACAQPTVNLEELELEMPQASTELFVESGVSPSLIQAVPQETKAPYVEPLQAALNAVLEANGVPEAGLGAFSASMHVASLPGVEVFYAGGPAGNHVVVYSHEESSCHYLWLPCFTVHSVALGEGKDEVVFYTEGDVFDFDRIFYDNATVLTYRYTDGALVKTWRDTGPYTNRRYGVMRGDDAFYFDDCRIKDGERLYLTFRLQDDSTVDNWPCSEIFLFETDEGGGLTFLFKDTKNTLPPTLLGEIEAMEGVRQAECEEVAVGTLQGTALTLWTQAGYRLDFYFNESGNRFTYEDFNIAVVRD